MEQFNVQALSCERRGDTVKRQLSHMIANGTLKPGDTLPSESELAARFGVSKPVIREALRGLATLGVLHIQHGKPACVRSLTSEALDSYFRFAVQSTEDGLKEAIELRRTLESEIAELAAKRATDEEIRTLEGITVRMARDLETLDPWVSADVEFHLTVARSAKNRLMLHLMEALSGFLKDTIRLLHSQRELRDSRATLSRHMHILEALKARDSVACRQAMVAHFEATTGVVEAIVHSSRFLTDDRF